MKYGEITKERAATVCPYCGRKQRPSHALHNPQYWPFAVKCKNRYEWYLLP